jgi:hypothetical protein
VRAFFGIFFNFFVRHTHFIIKYKEQKKLQAYQKELLNDKVSMSDKEIKENTKKGSHINFFVRHTHFIIK